MSRWGGVSFKKEGVSFKKEGVSFKKEGVSFKKGGVSVWMRKCCLKEGVSSVKNSSRYHVGEGLMS